MRRVLHDTHVSPDRHPAKHPANKLLVVFQEKGSKAERGGGQEEKSNRRQTRRTVEWDGNGGEEMQ